jgi:hypothetical protein
VHPGTPERTSNHRFSAMTFHNAQARTHLADPLHPFTRNIAKRTQFHRPIQQHPDKDHLRNEANSVRPAPPSADPRRNGTDAFTLPRQIPKPYRASASNTAPRFLAITAR